MRRTALSLVLAASLAGPALGQTPSYPAGPTNQSSLALIAPTPATAANNNQIATTAWVNSFISLGLPLASGKIYIGSVGNIATAQTMSGDVTISIGGVTTFATVNANVGTFGSATQCVTVTNNAKGLTTAISAATCTPAIGSITGLGTGIATALGVNVGTPGSIVVNGGALGTPSSGTATSLTGLPISTGLTGAGTGVLAALAVNVGSAGAFVTFNGALGTPSSGTATNLTGTAAGLTAGNVTTNANLTGEATSVGNAVTLTNSAVIAKVLTGYTSGAGTVAATDSILAAIQKLNGNDGLKAPLASPTLTGTPVLAAPSATTLSVGTTSLGGYILKVVGGNANQMAIDNTSQQFTEFDYLNNGVAKAVTYWDNSANAFIFRTTGAGTVGFDTANTRRLSVTSTAATGSAAIIATTYLQNAATTVLGLPTCNSGLEGARYGVTDATVGSAIFGTVLVGGSTVHTSAYCNGTSWVGG